MNDLAIDARYGVPPFRFLLPPGWVERSTSSEASASVVSQASKVFRQAGRPDLDAQFRAMQAKSAQGMAKARVFATYQQYGVDLDELLPMVITASSLRAEQGTTLDPVVADAFRRRGAEMLDEDGRIVRWAEDVVGEQEMAGLSAHQITYLIPVPGAGRRTALTLTTTIAHGLSSPIDVESLDLLTALSDGMIATFIWLKAPGESDEFTAPHSSPAHG